MEGTRYCYLKRIPKNLNRNTRMEVILKVLFETKFITNLELRMNKDDFRDLLNEMLEKKLIKLNNHKNKFFTNGYNIDELGQKFIESRQYDKKLSLSEFVGKFVGTAVGHFYQTIIDNNSKHIL